MTKPFTIFIFMTMLIVYTASEKITHQNFRTATQMLDSEAEQAKLRVGVLSLQFTSKFRNTSENLFKLAEDQNIDPLVYYNKRSFIAKSYISWLQDQGVEVVPVDINLSDEAINNILSTLNGIVLTGGANSLFNLNQTIMLDGGNSTANLIYKPSYYLLKVGQIIEAAKHINETRKFSVWAICLGFESLLISQSGNTKTLDDIDNLNYSAPIVFVDDEESDFGNYINGHALMKDKMETQPLAYFTHKYGFLTESFKNNRQLSENFRIVATSVSKQQKDIVALVEHKTLPFIASQYHPEKNKYETNKGYNINHSAEAIEASNLMAKYFIETMDDWRYQDQQPIEDIYDVNPVIEFGPTKMFTKIIVLNSEGFE